ncbi:MAG: hypothetical protein AAB923_03295 [Patescibacteria group bacterium]
MNKAVLVVIALLAAGIFAVWYFYPEGKPLAPELSQAYESGGESGVTIRYPEGWSEDTTYAYQELGPDRPQIYGVKFYVPRSFTDGTNLSEDTGLSLEILPGLDECVAGYFLSSGSPALTLLVDDVRYSVAYSDEGAAGNRYEETVYALHGTDPCIAVRYFIHYGVYKNYEPGLVKEFDREALVRELDAMRRTLFVPR